MGRWTASGTDIQVSLTRISSWCASGASLPGDGWFAARFILELCALAALGYSAGRHGLAVAFTVAVVINVALISVIPPPAETPGSRWTFGWALVLTTRIHANRGDMEEAERSLRLIEAMMGETHDAQTRTSLGSARATVLAGRGDHREALEAAEEALTTGIDVFGFDTEVRDPFVQAVESALHIGELERAQKIVDLVGSHPPGELPPGIRAHLARFQALLASARGEIEAIEQGFSAAEGIFDEAGESLDLAVVQLENAEWLAGRREEERAVCCSIRLARPSSDSVPNRGWNGRPS